MHTLKDIENKEDIRRLLDEFYLVLKEDDLVGFFFTEVVQINFDTHIPLIAAFWESILLGTAGYKGNPMLAHIDLSRKSRMRKEHFDRWLQVWEATIDRLFKGSKAAEAKTRAHSIAGLMLFKIEQDQKNNI